MQINAYYLPEYPQSYICQRMEYLGFLWLSFFRFCGKLEGREWGGVWKDKQFFDKNSLSHFGIDISRTVIYYLVIFNDLIFTSG
jgi:hypothetical protein